ncbi:MAG TPA: glycerate kinase [Thermoleophilaceae bacterium]
MNSILVAPDSFKGTLAASEVAAAVAAGLRDGGVEAVELPVGDGGEGTMDALLATLGGERRRARVSDPLGRPLEAEYALIDGGERAIVEMARASGLGLVAEGERDAFAASTRGTGELIAAAAADGAREVIVTAGGSATTDGGAGALEALDDAGAAPKLTVVCDVRTPWELAPRVFAPQKGADPETVKRLERRLARLAKAAPRDPRGVPMTGAAGGLAGGLWAHLGASLVPGATFVLDTIGFDDAMRAARFVVTGEGSIDHQTLAGKVVFEVGTRCRQAGVACHAVAGRNELAPFEARLIDLATITEAGTKRRLRSAGRRLADL